ncbi:MULTISPECIES: RecQ family ATP-dependent DNA helicase [Butyricimonas]|jgi:ATP-dependent DNA helicase, recQ family|uniref:ATP-dependent DNA helicase RecQ n=1 Tax=Butyricimonas faecihominis TaxID=1472416 RepID=A0A7W6HTH2_9BACT|nr:MULTISPECIES: RecQ family ATP-dependent DNA helicase [Butyricimonas]KAB1509234.1 RecQ family ATP-dependent DNA helicase [Butyricimonas faecihominis]MBB4024699.1 ATP-dependent DNA helicase RecQ [Butyricimonas faecihominis]WOF08272.1 RecQ family ATP-dependent DNA helicase [Butyricimonas faecihominis]BEI55599.1 ATP-dependent DNA helicase RecQ [Butyricimonas faecihominis]GGJ17746.1 ATP-dependent DNA helicase RecQ [Butyricimonas faecihominis]
MTRDIKEILKTYWGYDDFRSLQEETIRSVLDGKDTLALMPTGGGKSLTYQVSGLAMEGVCLVVTPLIALMKDQVEDLKNRQIPAEAIYTGMRRDRVESIINKCIYDTVKFLYVSPERLYSERFREKLRLMNVCLITVDEAHCISQWGYDFRPPYLRIAEVREFFPGVATLALTATATPEVVEDIQKQLHFSTPNVLSKSFRRENISYVIRDTEAKPLELFNILSKVQGGAIVYVRTRLKASSIAAFLNKSGIKSDFYHAGLSSAQRARRQEAWKSGMVPVVVATNAFGMGIDKADVRVVVHYDVPDSPEAYFQEAGRAGRDGKRAYAVLLSSRAALGGLQKRIDDAFPPKDYILRVYEALANYYQLGEGEGQGRAFEFNLKLFARNFKLNEARVMSAISILEVAGFLGYTTDINSRSRVMFTVLRDRLYEFETGDPLLERLMVLLMRNYAGIFVQDAYVDEGFLADQLDVTRKVLYDAFISLAKRKIIRYVPGDVKPYIVYYQPRLPLSYITLGREAYENRKELFVTKIGAMARYIRDDETCRQLLLMEYFGQKEEKPCGICDVCIGKKKRLHREERKSLEEQILQVLAKQNTNIRELVRQLGEDEEVVIGQVRKLLDEGKIQYVSTLELGITRKS